RCYGSVEVLLGHAVDEVPRRVRQPGPHEGHVALDRGYEDLRHAVELAHLRVPEQVGVGSGGREEPADASTAGPEGLGEAALREQLHLQPPLVDGLHGLGVAREVRADRAPELTVAQQPAPAETRLAYVVPYVGQVAH